MKKWIATAALLCLIVNAFAQELRNTRQQIVSPEFNANSVTFRIAAPAATDVKLQGSWMKEGDAPTVLTKEEDGVWSVTIDTPAPEIYTYNFDVNGANVCDINNFMMQRDGRRYLSILLVDGPRTANYKEANQRGTLNKVWYDSPTIGTNRRMYVYTPYGYENSTQQYPVLYILHGSGGDEDAWSNMGRACQILDNLIEQGKAKPMIMVMPNGNPGQQAAQILQLPEKRFDRQDPKSANIYIHSIAKDIVPYIEQHYRVIADPDSRAIAGLSMGGGHTIALANNYPGMFNYICPLSMGIREGQEMDKPFQELKKAGYKLYWVGCGDEDFLFESVQALDKTLTKNGLEHTFFVNGGGHTWSNWRIYLNEFAPLLFK